MNTKNMIMTANLLMLGTLAHAQSGMARSVNEHASVKCSRSIWIAAAPDRVWSVLTRIDDWARWQPDIKNPKLTGPLKPQSTFTWKTGGAKIHSTLHTVETGRAFGWTGKTMGMFAIHNWRLAAENGGTRVTVDESMEGWLTVLFRKSFNKNLEAGMVRWLAYLKEESEK